jgi:hypothetical protein
MRQRSYGQANNTYIHEASLEQNAMDFRKRESTLLILDEVYKRAGSLAGSEQTKMDYAITEYHLTTHLSLNLR